MAQYDLNMTKTDTSRIIDYSKALFSYGGLEVFRVYRRSGNKSWDLTGPVRFPSHHIMLVTSGKCTFHLMGESVTLHRGEVLVTTPWTDVRCDDGDVEEYSLLSARFDPKRSAEKTSHPQPPAQGGYVVVRPKREATFEVMMEQLLRAWNRTPESDAVLAASAILHAMLWVLCEELSEVAAESRDHRMEAIRKTLDEDPESQVTIPELAKQAGLSEGHFSRRFKKHVGISPKGYQHQICMRHAHFMLQEEDLSVQEVADRLGYSDAFVFSRQFKKTWGVSPSKV